MCYNSCPILVHVVDGVVVNIEGNPNSTQSRGKMCARGKAGVMNLYNPNRLLVPMKRTNPVKGIESDPHFVEITWKEALDTITEKLKLVMQEDPKGLLVQCWGAGTQVSSMLQLFGSAFGTPNIMRNMSSACGKVIHPVENIVTGGFHQEPDLHYCNYLIAVGTQLGLVTRFNFTHNMKELADARTRGMKVVSIDPVGFFGAAKVDEWIPAKPGTDSAFALAMINILLNELGICDAEFIKKRTNGAYLVGPDGLYVRDSNNKPMIWDHAKGKAFSFDDPNLAEPSILGRYEVDGITCTPGFQLLKEHVKKYTSEYASRVTTIPAETIRRITKEFGEAAKIGATITIDGKTYPFRPVAVDWGRGSQGHAHGFWNCWALKLVNIIVGAIEVPGGLHGTGTSGNWPVVWSPMETPDGLVRGSTKETGIHHGGGHVTRKVSKPVRHDLSELFPVAGHSTTTLPLTILEPERFGLDYKIKAAMFSPANAFLGAWGDTKLVERALASIPFMVSFCIERNEVAEMADIILPATSYLEALDVLAQEVNGPQPTGMHDRCYGIRQPVVDRPENVRDPADVTLDLAANLGISEDYFDLINLHYMLKTPFKLEPSNQYEWADVVDHICRSDFGAEHSADWFKEHGVLSHPVTSDIAYPGPTTKGRIPIYLEQYVRMKHALDEFIPSLGWASDWDTSDYSPLPDFLACKAAEVRDGEQDSLLAVNFKIPYAYGAHACENPWLDELGEASGYGYSILINAKTAAKRGIKHRDWVRLESPTATARARAFLTECIHPEVVGIPGHSGHWAREMRVSRGKGVNFESLLQFDLSSIDKISSALDSCVRVRVSKEKGSP